MNVPTPPLFAIGKVEKAFGVHGEVIVRPMTDSPGRFRKLTQAYIGRDEKRVRKLTVESSRVDTRGVRLKFSEATDRTSAQSLAGCLIFVDEKHLVRPKKGAHFIHDVVGLEVIDENKTKVGVVKEVLRLPAQDVFVIDRDGSEWMLPAVREFITSVDVKSKTLNVRAIEGLIDLS